MHEHPRVTSPRDDDFEVAGNAAACDDGNTDSGDQRHSSYNVFQALVLSFFSRQLYYDVAHHWKGVGACYLAMVVLFVWLPLMVTMHLAFNKFIAEDAPKIIQQIPDLALQQGVLSADVEQPHTIFDPGTQQPLIVIDTTGQFTSLDQIDTRVLVTRTEFMTEDDSGRVRTLSLVDVDDFELDAAVIQGWIGSLTGGLEAVMFAFCVAGNWVYRFVQVFALAIVASFVIKSGTIRFMGLMRLAAVALTPTMVVCTLAEMFQLPTRFWYWWPFCVVFILTYFYFAVTSRRGNFEIAAST
ncbi:MAG: DUF1189 domain-containing protein [Pirellulaceae bacterium]|nr:DUF1189 domain-containing protein [Pirellulaceae bacterium]